MLDIILQILSILGIILLVLLILFFVVVLLALFFPVTYRIKGSKDEEGMRLSAKAKWLFGLLRLNYSYPESQNVVVKALWFKIFDSASQREENPEEDGKSKKTKKRRSKKDKKEENRRKKAGRKNGKESGGTSGGKNNAPKEGGNSNEKEDTDVADKTVLQDGRAGHGPENNIASDNYSDTENSDTEPNTGTEDSGIEPKADTEHSNAESNSETGNEPQEETAPGFFGKIFQKFLKIKYTICGIYDKIKKIWENISYYPELLQEDDTKQLFSEALQKLLRILKNIRPRRMKADILFGANSPDTTGYVYGIYCMMAAVFGGGFRLTPDFEREIFRGEFDVSGHATIAVLLVNGLKLLLDKKLKRFIEKMKDGKTQNLNKVA